MVMRDKLEYLEKLVEDSSYYKLKMDVQHLK